MDDTKLRSPDDERDLLNSIALIEANELNSMLGEVCMALAVTTSMLCAYILFKSWISKW